MKPMGTPKKLHKTTRKKQRNPVVRTHEEHDTIHNRSVTYQLELVQCGKPKCKRWHGPYWYAYWKEQNRSRTLYIGKRRRPASEVINERDRRNLVRAEKRARDYAEGRRSVLAPTRAKNAKTDRTKRNPKRVI